MGFQICIATISTLSKLFLTRFIIQGLFMYFHAKILLGYTSNVFTPTKRIDIKTTEASYT